MSLPVSDGVTERLAHFLDELGKHLRHWRQRASFAMYMLGLLSQTLPYQVHIPSDVTFNTKPEIALCLLERAKQNGCQRSCAC